MLGGPCRPRGPRPGWPAGLRAGPRQGCVARLLQASNDFIAWMLVEVPALSAHHEVTQTLNDYTSPLRTPHSALRTLPCPQNRLPLRVRQHQLHRQHVLRVQQHQVRSKVFDEMPHRYVVSWSGMILEMPQNCRRHVHSQGVRQNASPAPPEFSSIYLTG
ncbi:hypothetical protein E2542_SST18202 [Spatholobus suberectus]|nr:hypothetical protein E2542_SST18202 [Spatholobus suberectus]